MAAPSRGGVINLPGSNRSTLCHPPLLPNPPIPLPHPAHRTTATLLTNLCAVKGTDLRPHCCQKQAEDTLAHNAVECFTGATTRRESFLHLFTPLRPRLWNRQRHQVAVKNFLPPPLNLFSFYFTVLSFSTSNFFCCLFQIV